MRRSSFAAGAITREAGWPALRRRATAVFGVSVVACAAACMPPIAHSPVVQPGSQFVGGSVIGLGLGRSPDSLVRLVGWPSLMLREQYGFRQADDPLGAAAEVGGEFLLFNGLLADAYVQAPKRWTGDVDAGIGGAFASFSHHRAPTAYLQVGRLASPNVYVFTTQSAVRLRTIGESRQPLLWQPTLAIQPITSDGGWQYFFLSATFGPTVDRCRPHGVDILTLCAPAPVGTASFGLVYTPRPGTGARRRWPRIPLLPPILP